MKNGNLPPLHLILIILIIALSPKIAQPRKTRTSENSPCGRALEEILGGKFAQKQSIDSVHPPKNDTREAALKETVSQEGESIIISPS